MKSYLCLAIAILVTSCGLPGCRSPVGTRGEIHVGDTLEMVQDRLGQPDEKSDGPNTNAHQATWIYANYYPVLRQSTGWSEVLVSGIKDQDGQVVQPPVTREIYRTPRKDAMQVVFTDGLVSSIDHLEP